MKTNRLTPKKAKPVITPYSCMCNTIDCILKDNKTYREYADKVRTEYAIHEVIKTFRNEGKFTNDYSSTTSIHIRTTEDPINITKCKMAKEYLNMLILLEDTIKKNNEFAKTCDTRVKPMIGLMETNKTLGAVSFKLSKELLELQEKNEWLENDNLERKQKEKEHRRELKELKYMMSKMTFNEIKTVELSSDEDLSDEEPEPTEEQPEPVKPIACIESIKPNLIQTYEKVKNYMVKNASSIGSIAKRMNYNQSNILKVCDSFINLRRMRNMEAHPETNDIIDDHEFLTLLELY
jgi:hypothetical protein